jgi:lysophospholipid acyltransferase (LPLAT)-like uncharacterized protein
VAFRRKAQSAFARAGIAALVSPHPDGQIFAHLFEALEDGSGGERRDTV